VAATFWQSLWWSYFASLPEDRICYRTIQKHKVASILEIGIEDGVRAERMIQMAIRNAGPRVVSYVGIDLFEAHPDSDGDSLTLKQAHQQFTALGARVKLVPGEAFPALDRIANSLKDIDLVVVGWDHDPTSLEKCWNLMPRFMNERTIVLRQGGENENYQFQTLTLADIQELAATHSAKTRAKKNAA
jgi:hypothetical protein